MSEEGGQAPWYMRARSFRYGPASLVLCLGIGLSASAYFLTAESQEREHVVHLLNSSAGPLALAAGRTLDRHIEVVQAIVGHYVASDVVDRRGFRKFVERGLERNPGIQALEWVPRVTAGERAAYEERAQLEGDVNFRITERNAEGDMVPVAPREEYFPVYFVEPYPGNERAHGFDLASNPERLEALTLARDTGQAVATEAIKLVQESGNQNGFLVFVPVYITGKTPETVENRKLYLSGFVLGVFRIGDMFDAAIVDSAAAAAFDIYLIDESAAAGRRLLHYRPATARSAPAEPLSPTELYKKRIHATSIAVGGRVWALVFDHAAEHFDAHTQAMPLGVAGAGFLLTLILAQHLVTSSNRARRIQQLVDERSKALTAANSALKMENTKRKHVETALRASERRFAGILETASEAIVSVDGSHRIRMFNQGAEAIFGHAAAEVIGQPLEVLLPSRFKDGHRKHLEGFAAAPETNRESNTSRQIFGLRKDGSEFPAAASFSRLETDGGTLFTVVLRDITERNKMEDALRESEMRFRSVVENLPVGISLKDLEGRFLLVNSRFQEWYVPPGTDPVGMTSNDFYPKQHADFFTRQDRAVLESLETTESEGEVSFQDGSLHWVHSIKFPIFDAAGQTIGVGGINSDVTDRKRAEKDLRESEERFRCVLDNSPDAIFLKDLEGRFRLVNKRFEEWYGVSMEDALGQTSHDVFPKDFADAYALQDIEILQSGQCVSRGHEVPFADGTLHPIMVSKFPVFDPEGNPVGIGTVNTDLTEQRRMETQLHQNAKMEALGTLAGGIAHDLNNVMVPVLGLTKLTMKRLPEDSRAYGNLEKVLEASNRAKDLIKQILAFSRADKPKRVPILMDSIVNEVLAFVRSAIPATIEIRSSIEPDVGRVLADSTQLHQVLMNLATNAAHAMGEMNGVLEIALARVEVDRERAAQGSDLEPGPHVRLTVRDTGCGMDEKTARRIFDPFFTTKGVGEGTGMGLAVVHGIVTRHEASITVSSRPGRGTTFEVLFPICEADTTGSETPKDCQPDTTEGHFNAAAAPPEGRDPEQTGNRAAARSMASQHD